MTESKRVPDINKLYDGMAKIHRGLSLLRSELDPDGNGGNMFLRDLEYFTLLFMFRLRRHYGVPIYQGEMPEEDTRDL